MLSDQYRLIHLGVLNLVAALSLSACKSTNTSVVSDDETPVPDVLVNPTGPCDQEQLNEWGFSNRCECPEGYMYNPVIGKCGEASRICTQAIVMMYHPQTGKCTAARNGCVAGDLAKFDWRRRQEGDECNQGHSTESPPSFPYDEAAKKAVDLLENSDNIAIPRAFRATESYLIEEHFELRTGRETPVEDVLGRGHQTKLVYSKGDPLSGIRSIKITLRYKKVADSEYFYHDINISEGFGEMH